MRREQELQKERDAAREMNAPLKKWAKAERARLVEALEGRYSNEMEEYNTALKGKGSDWVDGEFPGERAMGFVPLGKSGAPMSVEWRAALKGCHPCPPGVRPSPAHVVQGFLSDCWLLSAFAVLATRPSLLERLWYGGVQRAPEHVRSGVFVCRLWSPHEEQWKVWAVDPSIPFDEDSYPLFAQAAQSAQGAVWWAPLLEKAFVRGYCKTYHALNNGWPREALMRMIPFATNAHFELNSHDLNSQWEQLREWHRLGHLLTCSSRLTGTDRDLFRGVVLSHAYTVLDLKANVDGDLSLLQLRNPHGHGEFSGPYSDKYDTLPENAADTKWSRPFSDPPEPSCLSIAMGYSVESAVGGVWEGAWDDGAFWMSLTDFYSLFQVLEVTRIYPSSEKEGIGASGVVWKHAVEAGYWEQGKTQVRFKLTATPGADLAVVLTARPEPGMEDVCGFTLALHTSSGQELNQQFYTPPPLPPSAMHATERFPDKELPCVCLEVKPQPLRDPTLYVTASCTRPLFSSSLENLKFSLRVHATLCAKAAPHVELTYADQGEDSGEGAGEASEEVEEETFYTVNPAQEEEEEDV